jgi:hypothetical protein
MDWFQAARDELETFFDLDQQFSEEDLKARGVRAIDAFHDIFIRLTTKLKLRDEWPNPQCHIEPYSTGIIERSDKMQVDFTIGVSLFGWFVEAPITYPQQIGHMRDDYWQHIVRLASLGKAELHDYGRPLGWAGSPETKKLVQHKISLVYSIARDFTLLASIPDEDIRSVGGIHITIPVESDEATVTEFFEQGIDSLYKSNYLLYRSSYLQRKRLFKKMRLGEPPPLYRRESTSQTFPTPPIS